ncbi:hypothetical protein MLD38_006068 [Melastoma candidum]|uniref:Uncharacterized protein n=1 Tax=Melastoma candidum TaxID=119954 RepID=A0ACB9RV61_9MYRT|nr:hypothetical protein MLD38_006068 [Melastoma candidum]
MKEFWTTSASLLGVFAFCQTLLQSVFPPELRFAALKYFSRISCCFSSYCYFDITEIDGVNTNELYNAVQLYLSSLVSSSSSGTRLSLTRAVNSGATTFGLSNNNTISDVYDGLSVQWEHIVTQRQPQSFSWRPLPDEKRGFTLRIRKKDKHLVLDSYLDHIMEQANDIRRRNQERLLYTNSRGGSLDSRGHPWESVPFKHPSTFDTLAMDPEKKREIMDDLRDFADGQSFYHRTGRAWKRGYLLYGPPGTGKSSMIAAMANYLGYDIYDLELTEVHSNSELRKLLMKTSSKSIIVIEDIDCSVNLSNRWKGGNGCGGGGGGARGSSDYCDSFPPENHEGNNSKATLTLSGLLNFTDGLWSCCGSERIFVFTTNHIEKLDPALLRSGRMDMHIHMSHCGYGSLKILLKNYLGIDEEAEEKGGVEWEELREAAEKARMTPADVSEVLIKNRRDRGKAVKELIEAMREKYHEGSRECGGGETGGDAADSEDEEEEKRALDSPNAAAEEGGGGRRGEFGGSEEDNVGDDCEKEV